MVSLNKTYRNKQLVKCFIVKSYDIGHVAFYTLKHSKQNQLLYKLSFNLKRVIHKQCIVKNLL